MSVRNRFLVVLAALLSGGSPAHAQSAQVQPRAVVELFTSQGCSSCPAADALFVELARDPGLIALTFPVTYWDYLGWKDTLGQQVFSKRQKLYAKARGDGQVYTPQAVVNGASHIVGSDRSGIEKIVAEQGADGFAVKVALKEADGALQIALSPTGAPTGEKPAGVWVVAYSRSTVVPIERGENTGRTVTYANVVRGLTRVGDWSGSAATLTVPLDATRPPKADGYVVLVQTDQYQRGGAILGAARGGAR
ncbi:DUF1223 domain-containing protein [Bosea sp. (in: a-proteobacteria)]|uniref:DUF1223 domain-containing protein n=1 Tax=Bosea sp. (in: a-proteobacteria) TaxID=1871050 RepID=UPI002FC7571F